VIAVPALRLPRSLPRGLRWLHHKRVAYYRRARVVRCDSLDLDSRSPDIPIEIREASEEDLRRLAPMEENSAAEWLVLRARGSVCFVARSGREDVGYLWVTRSPHGMSEVDHVFDVSHDPFGAYLFSGYTLPAFRGKGVLRTLIMHAKVWARDRGISRLYSAFVAENEVSRHVLDRAGFHAVVGEIVVLCIAGREWKWISHPGGTPVPDVLRVDGSARNPYAAR
jgi:GNAT superfamily N-acetyltransferase